jgi:hypothetical protein
LKPKPKGETMSAAAPKYVAPQHIGSGRHGGN